MKTVDTRVLARAPPFLHLGAPQLRNILADARLCLLPAGSEVFGEGQPAETFHLLVSGNIRFTRLTADGDRVIMLHVSAGELFGIGSPLGASVRQHTAITADSCVILTWPAILWQGYADRHPVFACETLRVFGARSDEMSNRIVELSTKQVEQRIACALLRLISQSGRKVATGIEIGFPVSRQNIADMTGTTLHTVSRVLSAWEKLQVIESTRCHIVVTSPHRLVMISVASGRAPALQPVEVSAG